MLEDEPEDEPDDEDADELPPLLDAAVDPVADEEPLPSEDDPPLDSPLLLLAPLELPLPFDDEASLLPSDRFDVSGRVFEPAAPPLP